MGVKIMVSALIDLSPEAFWAIRNTPEYLACECEVLNFKTKECVDLVSDDNGVRLSLNYTASRTGTSALRPVQ